VSSLFILFQYLVPQHLLSRLVGFFASSRFFSRPFIYFFRRRYGIDLSEAEVEDPKQYPTFNAFFTRALKVGARELPKQRNCIVSPADGEISQIGEISKDRIFQAKGQDYSVGKLLACSEDQAASFIDGYFATVYLSPKDYHRVHMPLAGMLTKTTYVPGKLFSVNQKTAESVPELFAVNERLVCWFDTEAGQMVLVLVGAMIVAGIETVWSGHVCPVKGSPKITTTLFRKDQVALATGGEMGRFKLGSTAIVLFEKNSIELVENLSAGSNVKMGQLMAMNKTKPKQETS
jgi:phosphatidylserine decarboxylase